MIHKDISGSKVGISMDWYAWFSVSAIKWNGFNVSRNNNKINFCCKHLISLWVLKCREWHTKIDEILLSYCSAHEKFPNKKRYIFLFIHFRMHYDLLFFHSFGYYFSIICRIELLQSSIVAIFFFFIISLFLT